MQDKDTRSYHELRRPASEFDSRNVYLCVVIGLTYRFYLLRSYRKFAICINSRSDYLKVHSLSELQSTLAFLLPLNNSGTATETWQWRMEEDYLVNNEEEVNIRVGQAKPTLKQALKDNLNHE